MTDYLFNYKDSLVPKEDYFGVNFSQSYLKKHIRLPEKIENIPQILGWSGPARCGSTGLLFLLVSQPEVDRAYFQPQKTILRSGKPDFVLNSEDKLICTKEVFRLCCVKYNHDPIANLLEVGIPPEKITWIIMLREPTKNYASWHRLGITGLPQDYARVQSYTIGLFHKYRALGIKTIPFVYDLLAGGREEEVINALLSKTGLPITHINTQFNMNQIEKKLTKGQWQNMEYFEARVSQTLHRNKYVYSSSSPDLSLKLKNEVENLCKKEYEAFYRLAQQELEL